MLLKDIDKTCQRIIKAFDKNEKITLITDHDCDGQSSCAVLVWSLKHIFKYDNFDYFISHRTEEGYGITAAVVKRALAKEVPALILTADCGISCHDQIELLHEKGVDVIVTDHHTVPEQGIPQHAYSVINPQQSDCHYPDKNIAGCFVAWLVMAAVRKTYMEQRCVKLPSMAQCLDFVSIGTISDCMDLKLSLNNRIVIKHGLKLIRRKSKPAWSTLLSKYKSYPSCEFLSYKLIPLLNADGRLADALTSVKYLTACDTLDAQHALAHLVDRNEQRKLLTAKQVQLIEKSLDDQYAIIENLGTQGHCGIHGITASKMCQEYAVPSIIFSQSFKEGIISGSARSPQNISLKEILDAMNAQQPDLIEQYGGHHQAAGVSLKEENFSSFKEAFLKQAQKRQLAKHTETLNFYSLLAGKHIFEPKFWLDFENLLEPFGKEFEKPLFAVQCRLADYSLIGENKNHINLKLRQEGEHFKALLFFQKEPQAVIDKILNEDILAIGSFNYDTFLGKQSLTFYLKALYCLKSQTLLHEDSRQITVKPPLLNSEYQQLNECP